VTVAALATATPASPASGGPLGDWLAVEDPVRRCPAIVVLNGDQPARADEAARLFHAGAGAEIWLTNDPRSGNDDAADAGTQFNIRRLADAARVPATAIRVVPGAATGTAAELALIAAELRRRALSCALLVTSPLHGRRVKATWAHVAGAVPRAVVRLAPGAGHTGWLVELKELVGTGLAWIGRPR
jgi:hypothetical protein